MNKGIIISGILISIIFSIYITQFLGNEQINEIAEMEEERISKCDPNIDRNGNQIPDELEKVLPEELKEFSNKDWSNCTLPTQIKNYQVINSNLSHVNFQNSKIMNSLFYNVNFDGSNFSSSSLYGNIFLQSSINNVNFTDVDFYPNSWENPFIVFTTDNSSPNFSCYFESCSLRIVDCKGCENQSRDNWAYKSEGSQVLNLRLIDKIEDQSDRREIYRHVTGFYETEINQSVFKNSDLSHTIFSDTFLLNSVIESSNIVDILFDNTMVKNTTINEKYIAEEVITKIIDFGNNFNQIIFDKINEKPQPDNYKITVNIENVIDEIPVNWAMGMNVFEGKLYVAESDNHRIKTYDLDTLERKSEFTSPLAHHCESTHSWISKNTNCPSELRNLPTSIAILNEKIFVSYGFQDEIQEFTLNGKFLSKFGNTGNAKGEFNKPYKIAASDEFLYIADSGNKRIQIFDSNKDHVNQIKIPVPNQSEVNLDVEIYEDKIFVINNKTPDLMIFDLNGNLIDKILLEEKTGYSSISIEKNMIAVTNSDQNTISIFDMEGALMTKLGTLGTHYGEFNNPKDTVMSNGKIFVSDVYNYRIQVFGIDKK